MVASNIEQDVILNKKVSIERCVLQIQQYYSGAESLRTDYMQQDAIAINIQRIADLCIDIANYCIKKQQLGLPKDSADSFILLAEAGLISESLLAELKGMVGFRNILVHQYTQLNLDIMVDVIEQHLQTPTEFAQIILKAMLNSPQQ